MADSKLTRWLIATELASIREEAGLSRTEAARVVGVGSSETIRKWEVGENQPYPYAVKGICDLYGTDGGTVEYLRFLYGQRDSKNIFPQVYEPRPLLRAEKHYDAFYKFEPQFIPNVLQVEGYHFAPELRDRRFDDRRHQEGWILKQQRRKELKGRGEKARVVLIVGEAAMLALDQLSCREHQVERMKRAVSGGWDIRVVRIPHPYMYPGYEIFSSGVAGPPAKPAFVYSEMPDKSEYIEEADRVDSFTTMFDIVLGMSISLRDYLALTGGADT
ncbi:Scr1 family TA system antitoxin-like transcriptional regulator [Salininema proteolyticum]|uniref:Scr1 family TA system antitoxin-like transcriptional regulator n=1 Tax=Salininema proteolyticum TaxID=1607685 RepID=A0ABV8U3Y3_9ACTN